MSFPKFFVFISAGFILVLLGALLPFLIIMRVLESTFFLNFFAYGASIIGLFLGFIGASLYVREHRGKK
jgi:hypothetical protein